MPRGERFSYFDVDPSDDGVACQALGLTEVLTNPRVAANYLVHLRRGPNTLR